MSRPIAAAVAAILFVGAASLYVGHGGPRHHDFSHSRTRFTATGDAIAVNRFLQLERGRYAFMPPLRLTQTAQRSSATFLLPAATDPVRLAREALDAGLSYTFKIEWFQGTVTF